MVTRQEILANNLTSLVSHGAYQRVNRKVQIFQRPVVVDGMVRLNPAQRFARVCRETVYVTILAPDHPDSSAAPMNHRAFIGEAHVRYREVPVWVRL